MQFPKPSVLLRLAAAFVGGAIVAQLMYPFSGPENPSWRGALAAESAAVFPLALVLAAGSESLGQIVAVWLFGLLGMADGVIARAGYDFFFERGDHNLLPFEVMFAAALAFPGALAGTAAGSALRYVLGRIRLAGAKA
jgi:hypothetical protein